MCLCRIAEQYLKKGSKVFIEGALQTRKWQDQSGQDRYSTEVVLQGFRGELTLLDRAGGAGTGAGGGGGDFGADDTSDSVRPGRRARSRPQPARAAAAGAARWTMNSVLSWHCGQRSDEAIQTLRRRTGWLGRARHRAGHLGRTVGSQ